MPVKRIQPLEGQMYRRNHNLTGRSRQLDSACGVTFRVSIVEKSFAWGVVVKGNGGVTPGSELMVHAFYFTTQYFERLPALI